MCTCILSEGSPILEIDRPLLAVKRVFVDCEGMKDHYRIVQTITSGHIP